jgi:AcrR family transcriptional regulator
LTSCFFGHKKKGAGADADVFSGGEMTSNNEQNSLSGTKTRDRILAAAVMRFSTMSYEETKLRDIATDVGVDVAFVHRSFGSKEKLFEEALDSLPHPDQLLETEEGDLVDAMLAVIPEEGEPHPIGIVIYSLGSPVAAPMLRNLIQTKLVEPLAKKFGQEDVERATLAAAFLTGIGLFRRSQYMEPLLSDEAIRNLEPTLRQVINTISGKA